MASFDICIVHFLP